MKRPDFWIIAGPNGAGKTTLVRRGMFARLVPINTLVNPDDITLEYLKAEGMNTWAEAPLEAQKRLFAKAADEAQRRLENKIEHGETAVVESVLSTNKYKPLVERVLQKEGRFFLIYVLLSSPHLSRSRVSARADLGGHDVPSEKLARRWRDSLSLAPWFASRATRFWIVDNSSSDPGVDPMPVITGGEGAMCLHPQSEDVAVDAIALRLARGIVENSEDKWLILEA